ncbi:beta-ketoacyl-[acyl-carrier-protein] synthase family protein [Aliikangiella sp. IMCC44359]|uniref:beta-ketoacyl-[acyl-carrier-protein] synthase family protein n=1 Tax=Aliikangiella sp. IMCC44359 TaxID=3459125 RepID=UPI00403A80DB
MEYKSNRVLVTGLGVISTLGNNVDSFWKNLLNGQCGLVHQKILDKKETPFKFGGYIGELSANENLDPNQFKNYDRSVQLGLKASAQAIVDAGLSGIDKDEFTVAVVMGTTCGTNDSVESDGFDEKWFNGKLEECETESFEKYGHELIANTISKTFGFCGPSYVVGTACASGNHAIGEAINLIKNEQADIVLCGGSDAFTMLPTFGFYAMKSLATEKCTPFQKGREGMILGEGAGVLVLESEESAKKRGRPALAALDAWALNCDAKNFAAPIDSGERCQELIELCLKEAQLKPDSIDYINVHGTGTEMNDLMEARGINGVFKSTKQNLHVSSIKGALGHTLGAAGALDGITSVLSIANDCIPPNAPISKKDENIDLNITTEPVFTSVNKVLSISFAFGGCNVATLFSKV